MAILKNFVNQTAENTFSRQLAKNIQEFLPAIIQAYIAKYNDLKNSNTNPLPIQNNPYNNNPIKEKSNIQKLKSNSLKDDFLKDNSLNIQNNSYNNASVKDKFNIQNNALPIQHRQINNKQLSHKLQQQADIEFMHKMHINSLDEMQQFKNIKNNDVDSIDIEED